MPTFQLAVPGTTPEVAIPTVIPASNAIVAGQRGLEIATLLKSGDIEIFINQFQDNTDDCVCGAPYKIERGTAEYEAALKAHGPLKEGVPHSIRLYPRNETATK